MPLWSERVLVVFPDDHPLAGRETVSWTDLRGETVLLSHCDLGKELGDLLVSKLVAPDDRPKIERHVTLTGFSSSIAPSLSLAIVIPCTARGPDRD